jgi:ethanolaminephosphotransferase
MVYIRQSQLPKLKEYKYSGTLRNTILSVLVLEARGTRSRRVYWRIVLTCFMVIAVDHSLLSRYVLKPYWWSQVINIFPMSMAPNAITLSGFGFVIANVATMLYYSPNMDQDCPVWVYWSWAIGLFLYQTFDAVDGTQA